MDFTSSPINKHLWWKRKYQNTSQRVLDNLINNQSRILTFLLIGIFAMVISMSTDSRIQFAENQTKKISLPADILILKNLFNHKSAFSDVEIDGSKTYCEAKLQEGRSCQPSNHVPKLHIENEMLLT